MPQMFDGFQRRRVDLGDGIHIACATRGAGPPVLLLHGYPQTLALWARVAPILSARYTVVCADLRGYGDSSKPQCSDDHSNYSFRALAGDQLALMRHLGFSCFHVIGHDRGGRTAHRMALDHPDAVLSLAVLDIVPTMTMFMETDQRLARAYWHWYFLAQPEPLPERLIGNDPDFFFETCLVGWGAAKLEDFDADMLAEYRRAWRTPGMIHGSCSDYRAAASVDLDADRADADRKVRCATLVLYGAAGVMAALFDIPAEWRKRCARVTGARIAGGHFFVDQHPEESAAVLLEFLDRQCATAIFG